MPSQLIFHIVRRNATKLTFVAVFALSLSLTACDSGVSVDEVPQVHGAAFVGSDTLWVVTTDGKFLRTLNGGVDWTKVASPANVRCIDFNDLQRGWALDSTGEVWRTEDGGQDWRIIGKLEAPGFRLLAPLEMKFIDAFHGWVIETFSVWRTEDGGKTWKISPKSSLSQSQGQPISGSFLNAHTAWVSATNGEVYNTEDGGESWEAHEIQKGTDFHSVFFLDELTGWSSGWPNGGIYVTGDGGRTWQLQLAETPKHSVGIQSIYFIDKNNGWAVGRVWPENIGHQPTRAIVLRSKDGGKNWQPTQVEDNEPFFDRVFFADAEHGWLFGRDKIFRTEDGGENWHTALRLTPLSNGS